MESNKALKSTVRSKETNKDSAEKERELLEEKVIKGTDFAVREYGEVFRKLAEYDQSN